MKTWTLNRDFSNMDCMYAALNDNCYADLKDSANVHWNDRIETEKKGIFHTLFRMFA